MCKYVMNDVKLNLLHYSVYHTELNTLVYMSVCIVKELSYWK